MSAATGVRLGFACHWDSPAEATWSGTPWRLRDALRAQDGVDVIDVGPRLSRPVTQALRVAGARRSAGAWRSQWRHSATAVRLLEADVLGRVRAAAPDVVLQVQDLARPDTPFLVLQDLSYGLLLERFGRDGVPHFRTLGRRRVEQLRRRQEDVYRRAAGLLPMSRWLADQLVRSGVEPGKVHVAHPGINVPVPPGPPPQRRQGPVRRLIMVGRDFETKGGAQTVAAFALLRRELGPAVELTVVGPPRWPLRGPVPDGVAFLGPRPAAEIGPLLDSHDLFVMPSLFEGFGIAFAEALVRGLPCIGRDDCAMPEIIDPASGGRLVRTEDPGELAAAVLDALADDDLYEQCARLAPERRRHYSWQRAARQVVQVAGAVVAGAVVAPDGEDTKDPADAVTGEDTKDPADAAATRPPG